MNIFENIMVAIASIKANKMRAFLTMLGIVIGIAAVVSISAIANGGKKQIEKSFEQFGTNRLIIQMNWSKWEELKFRDYLTEEDISVVGRMAGDGDIEAVSPLYGGDWLTLSNRGRSSDIVLYGVNEFGAEIDNVKMLSGRFVSQEDMLAKRNVVIISEKDARELFGTVDVLGKPVTLDTWRGPVELTIAGVTKYEDNFMNSFTNGGRAAAYIPISTIMKIYREDRYYALSIKVKEKERINEIGGKIIALLERRHHTTGKYSSFNLQQMLDTIIAQMSMITTVLALVAAIALLVGGIGIMNIMLVSVTERTREIGIRKAIGAKRRAVLFQFLIEAGIISLGGGILGILLGIGIAWLISLLMKLPPIISIVDIAIAFVFSVIIGLVFGVYPASKASKLDPIVALRYE
ncbi:MAG: ABC-type antimicrobial peptide transport system, permease component [Firmicutes bacterium]|nr:ABC-type antimicrobial peptide transport system, permease component [Bacillota bacterium]MDI6707028.1 ABC transporter permease [Bacillota bacterium]